MMVAPRTFLCPSCSSLVSPQAELCPICQTQIHATTGIPPEELEQVRRAVNDLTAAAGEPADLTVQAKKFRTASHVWGLIFVACTVGAVASNHNLMPLTILLASIAGIVAMFLYINDLTAPSVRGRRAGLQALACYFKGVRYRRWGAAHGSLSSIARARNVTVPSIPEMRCVAAPLPFATEKDVKKYWSSIIHPGSGMYRRITALRFRHVPTTDPNLETYVVDMEIQYYPTWINWFVLAGVIVAVICMLILQRTQRMSFPVTLIKHRSQWWMLSGEAYPRIDRALMTTAAALSA
ncbi:MAG: hypothetical protein JWO36_6284 [Myxococcales bacterium]|nr:hypothetical protein [Myxococcales bacterium]